MRLRDPGAARVAAQPLRVVVCDDSAFMCRTIALVLEQAGGMVVVGTAATGEAAVELCRTLQPDVLTLDLQLPGMDGLEVLAALAGLQVRTLVVSSATGSASTRRAVDALAGGALDVIGKPGDELGRTVFAARLVELVRQVGSARTQPPAARGIAWPVESPRREPAHPRLIVIGASTGGPAALDATLGMLPAQLPAAVLVVQHMPRGFSDAFARRLARSCPLDVAEAADGDPIVPGRILVAPSGWHLHVDLDRVYVREGDRVRGMRPSIDVTLMDAARTWGDRTTAVVLTGIGTDGLDGAHAVSGAGGRVLVQDEQSCAVWGMPRAIEEAGLADAVASLDELPRLLVQEAWR